MTLLIQKLIKLSNPQADQKTIFIWPEGMLSGLVYLNEIKKYHRMFFLMHFQIYI